MRKEHINVRECQNKLSFNYRGRKTRWSVANVSTWGHRGADKGSRKRRLMARKGRSESRIAGAGSSVSPTAIALPSTPLITRTANRSAAFNRVTNHKTGLYQNSISASIVSGWAILATP
ncbi:hypothetical protein DPMN_115483 [Dreissena polymorpha]|uniref:Uncharacterized protein n=1 Tax=Dreissena polymorpha TaxID=45954 RepID=A0A9D4QTT2_DREPO|nr:hypothetical protein DPMN_115483 [Dreissena polymorpha]